jgi:glucose-1-phosphate cytidylyltransferase
MTKAVILAGGLGSRLSEETDTKPKPMVEIGGRPILWHIMQIFSAHGVSEFVICLGYKGYIIKEYFLNYRLHLSDVTVNIADGAIDYHRSGAEDWRVSLIETGDATMTPMAMASPISIYPSFSLSTKLMAGSRPSPASCRLDGSGPSN